MNLGKVWAETGRYFDYDTDILMMAIKSGERPVEYGLSSNGTQWIDTGVYPTNETEYEITFKYDVILTAATFVIGSRISSTSQNLSIALDPTTAHVGRGGPHGFSHNFATGQIYKFNVNKNNILLDDIIKSIRDNNYGDVSGTYSVRLFSCNQSGSNYSVFKGAIYSCKFWENGVLIRDFVPVPMGSTKYSTTPAPSNCMWDKVTQTYFENQGTGDFEIVEKSEIETATPMSVSSYSYSGDGSNFVSGNLINDIYVE